jgi:PPM family protein phosphatase
MRVAVATDPGRRRRHNEDAYVCEPPLFAIADGMGGAQAGEIASGLAAAVLSEASGDERGEDRVRSLVEEANRRVYRRSNEDAAASGMGTTMTVALVDDAGSSVAVAHVGDSRAYRVRGGELEQLTDDHSLVGELVRGGKLSAEEAEAHPQRSVITRAVGTEADVDVDTFTVEIETGDLYLLCSDGLTDMVPDREILALLAEADDLDRAVHALVDAANAGGGEDNITVVLFAVDGDDDTATMPAVTAEQEHDDDEDTLSGLDAVPAVDTAVVPAAEIRDHLRRQEREPKRSLVPLLVLVVLLVVLVALAFWGLTR